MALSFLRMGRIWFQAWLCVPKEGGLWTAWVGGSLEGLGALTLRFEEGIWDSESRSIFPRPRAASVLQGPRGQGIVSEWGCKVHATEPSLCRPEALGHERA
jgi:hypothetical protein